MKRDRPNYARMSDPEHNPQWRRRWTEPEERPLPKVPRRILSWRQGRDGPLK